MGKKRMNPFKVAEETGKEVAKRMKFNEDDSKETQEQKKSLQKNTFRQTRWLLLLGVVFLIGILLYTKWDDVKDLFSGDPDDSPDRAAIVGGASPPRRQCRVTEQLCPASSLCRKSNGALEPPIAESDLGACCLFACETPPVRACLASEKECAAGVGCKFGTLPAPVMATTSSGRACCTFDCDADYTLPERDCFSSETLCPHGNKCMSFNSVVSSPSAINPGGVCCRYNGKEAQCVAP